MKKKKLHASEQNRQLKMDSFPSEAEKKTEKEKKQITITKLNSRLAWDKLFLEVEFQLTPNKNYFSKIEAELWFDQEKTKSILFDIMQSFGNTNDFMLKATLDLTGIPQGPHSVKVEIYEIWEFIEKHEHAKKEITFHYTPETKIANLKKIPTIETIAGEGIVIITNNQKHLHKEMQETMKKEIMSKREE